MEFLDEESRPRFLFQSRPISHSDEDDPKTLFLHKPTLFISLSISFLLFFLSLLYFQSEPLKSLLFWFAFSLLLGPFAPSSLTAGDIRVGRGPLLLPPPPSQIDESNPATDSTKKPSNRRSKPKKQQDELFLNSIPLIVNESETPEKPSRKSVIEVEEEKEWTEGDVELLKKQMVKNPVGKPGRWEVISEAFNGRHGVESVIKTAKSLGEKKVSDSDSFDRFLKDRKPVDKRIEGENENVVMDNGDLKREKDYFWSGGEDIALLNALKAFPKDVAMRWEKITAAVPGKSKAACMKRVAELKRDFRSSKVSSTDA